MKDTSSKDLIEFIAINILFVDNFCLAIFWGYLMLIVAFHYEQINSNGWMLADGAIFLLIVLLKIFTLILYYETDYKRVTSPLVIKFIENLKDNKYYIRYWVLLVISFPYLLLTLYNIIIYYRWINRVITSTIAYFLISGIIPYLIFYLYLDYKKYNAKFHSNKKAA